MIWYQRDGSASPSSEYGGGGGSDRQTASFFGAGSSRPAPPYGPGSGGGGSSMRSMAGGRFTGGAGNGVASSGATRFSTSRHEGFRMTTPTRVRPSHVSAGYSSHGFHQSPGGSIRRVDWERTSPIHGLSYGRSSYRSVPQYAGSPARGRYAYPPPAHHQVAAASSMHHQAQSSIFPTAQQEADLAAYGLICQNGQIVTGKPTVQPAQYGQARPPSRNLPSFPSFNMSSNDPFITTPGNTYGLGKLHGSSVAGPSKLISTSPIPTVVQGGCSSPTFAASARPTPTAVVAAGQHSLLPVPHSPMLTDGAQAFFGSGSVGGGGWLSGAPGMHYHEGQ